VRRRRERDDHCEYVRRNGAFEYASGTVIFSGCTLHGGSRDS
jgi:hypothetical protein